jgi:predicted N-acetyltransferase YhbS
MVQWCVDEARRLGRSRLRIHTLTMMLGAQRLYERLGFVRDPAHDAEWDGIAGLAYRLDLAGSQRRVQSRP